MRVHLKKDAKGILKNPASIARLAAEVELPKLCAQVWGYFQELHARRQMNEAGPARIAWEAIHAWRTVRDIALDGWALKAILLLDDIFIDQYFESKK